MLTDLFLSNTDFGKYHIAILLVLICAWKMYVVDACFYMNDIHVKKYITELAYWPIFIKNEFWKIVQIYIIHSASTIVWITIKHISQCLRIVVSNTYCVVFLSCFLRLCVSYLASFSPRCSLTFILFTVWYFLWLYSHVEDTCMTASCQ